MGEGHTVGQMVALQQWSDKAVFEQAYLRTPLTSTAMFWQGCPLTSISPYPTLYLTLAAPAELAVACEWVNVLLWSVVRATG